MRVRAERQAPSSSRCSLTAQQPDTQNRKHAWGQRRGSDLRAGRGPQFAQATHTQLSTGNRAAGTPNSVPFPRDHVTSLKRLTYQNKPTTFIQQKHHFQILKPCMNLQKSLRPNGSTQNFLENSEKIMSKMVISQGRIDSGKLHLPRHIFLHCLNLYNMHSLIL